MGDRESIGRKDRDGPCASSGTKPIDENAYEGFAETISALQKLNRLESDIATMISTYKIPTKEIRKFFRCTTPDQVTNVSLFQYMKALFMQLGINLEITGIEPFCYSFVVRNSAISDLYSGIQGRTCDLVGEAISRFFQRELNQSCVAKEIRCVNAGDSCCEFEARIDKEDFCSVAVGDSERDILRVLSKSKDVDGLRQVFSEMSDEELDFRLAQLKRLDLVGKNGEVTKLGVKCSTQSVEEHDFEPPWREMSELASAISSALSFAEAGCVSLSEDSTNDSHDGKISDSKEVRECRSFAELLAKQINKESKTEGF